MRRIAVVGAGQSGTQLALGLLGVGYEVTLVSSRTPDELRAGHVLSSQCMFEPARAGDAADHALAAGETRSPRFPDSSAPRG